MFISPNRSHAPIHQISAVISALCIPLVPFSSSLSPAFMWFGRAAILLALACSVVNLRISRREGLSLGILTAFAALICVGFIGGGSGNSQQYVQIAQLTIIGVILAAHKRTASSPVLDWSLLTLMAVAVAINIAFPIAPVQDATHKFTDSVATGVFGNPNVLAIYCLLLFMISASIAWRATGSVKIAAAAFCAFLLYVAAYTESRSALIAFIAYIVVLGFGRVINGQKDTLRFVGAAALVCVPAIVIGYPSAMGLRVRFMLPPPAVTQISDQAGSIERITSAPSLLDGPVCVSSTFQACESSGDKAPPPLAPLKKIIVAEDTGIFGVHKKLASGRETIWAATIEISGENMAFGRGLGALPGAYLAPPYSGRSAHNGFLQVYFQFGLVGLALYFTVWALLIARATRIPDVVTRCSVIAIITAACVIETFEVMMIQNQLGTGVAFALLITTRLVPAHPRDATLP